MSFSLKFLYLKKIIGFLISVSNLFLEYTEMAKNLLEAFNDAVDRYLESDPSSDDEVAVDFAAHRHKERKHKDHKESKRSKSKRKRREKEKERSPDSGSGSDSDRQPPFLKPQRDR